MGLLDGLSPSCDDFERVAQKQANIPVPESVALCQHLARPYPDSDRCSVPPLSTRHSQQSPIAFGPIAPSGGGGGLPLLGGGQIYTFIFDGRSLSGGMDIERGTAGGSGGDGNRVHHTSPPPLDLWSRTVVGDLFHLVTTDAYTRFTTANTIRQTFGPGGGVIGEVGDEWSSPVASNLLSIRVNLENLLGLTTGTLFCAVYQGQIAGGAPPGGGPAVLPLVGTSAGVDVTTIGALGPVDFIF